MDLRECFWVGVVLCVGLSACDGDKKDEAGGGVDQTVLDDLAASEDDLLGKRDALFNMRQTISDKRAALVEERSAVEAAGGDTTEVDKKIEVVLAEVESLKSKESALNLAVKEAFDQRREGMSTGVGGGGPESNMTNRESGMAGRERQLARRESELSNREAALAKREEGLASKWKDGCAASAIPTTIIRTVDTKGSSYTKRDVEPLLTKARRVMSKKGLLRSDLPAQAKGLEKEANQGMKDGDYGLASQAARQLLGTVNAIKIDKGFIAAKIARLNRRIGGKSLSANSESLFRQATSSYGDAKFSSANSKLNKIYSSL